jgi:hypothetical protein
MNACTSHLLSLSVALCAVMTTGPAEAVALRPNKATDDSVCDLAHDTNLFLGSKTLVPSAAPKKDQVDAFFRMAASFIATKCRNGQVLVVQGATASSVDVQSLSEVANSACPIASVVRSEVRLPLGDVTQAGFELRCTILKHDELVGRLDELERTDPMDALKARLAAAAQQADRGPARPDASPGAKKDCGKMTLSSILQGGSCK